jgi:hypothetical protein
MDAVAITNASDELLKEMGLSKARDRLSLIKRFELSVLIKKMKAVHKKEIRIEKEHC